MNKYDLEEFKKDANWRTAFYEAVVGQEEPYVTELDRMHPIENVKKVIVASEGENSEADWIAVVEWAGANITHYAVLYASGWDCLEWGKIEYYDTLSDALMSLSPYVAKTLGIPHDSNPSQTCNTVDEWIQMHEEVSRVHNDDYDLLTEECRDLRRLVRAYQDLCECYRIGKPGIVGTLGTISELLAKLWL